MIHLPARQLFGHPAFRWHQSGAPLLFPTIGDRPTQHSSGSGKKFCNCFAPYFHCVLP